MAPALTYNHATFAGTNLIWNSYGSLNAGPEFLYGWKQLQNGQKAKCSPIPIQRKV
jgi:hypothetical protein